MVNKLAAEISTDYHDKYPLLIGVLKGSFMFMADLIRLLDFPLEVEFIRLSSYGRGRQSLGRVRVVQGLRSEIRGRDVLVVEDIVDSGHTLSSVLGLLATRKPASLKVCTLLDKAERRETEVPLDYVGFVIPNKYVFGYGLDLDEFYRELPFIGVVNEDKYTPPDH